MTTQEMLDWFDILQDKFGSPYFSDDQKLLFLNNAQNEYLNSLFPDNEGGTKNVEENWNVEQNASPLIWTLPDMVMNTSGIILVDDVKSALQTASSDPGTDIFDILSIEIKKGIQKHTCKVLRHNDKAAFEVNYFKKPSNNGYRYLLQNNNYQFRPTDTSVKVSITVVKEPKKLTLTPSMVNSEFPVQVHNAIVAYGLQFAGIASRDEVLSAMNLVQLPTQKQ